MISANSPNRENIPLALTFLFLAASAAAREPAKPPAAAPPVVGDDTEAAVSEPGTAAALRSRFSLSLTLRKPPVPDPPAFRIEARRSPGTPDD